MLYRQSLEAHIQSCPFDLENRRFIYLGLCLDSGFAMPQTDVLPRRPRGRPQVRPDDETLRVIVDAARDGFLSRSFGGVRMALGAQRAGVSTKTMYRLVPTKADIFRKVVSTRIGQFILELDIE